ncbi:Molybdenum cofactor biosynthesis protein MoaE [Sulfidibacter corallicola]|uniref:Molybdopterin synthase catalytic subunit n=1 Tax=Sulfidibacter corallicola TaxID=2818388 RepID=A0A8A4TFD8_SULCO|nr:molybdenum cofactor biosynthesis protein MoaE [Sulfidibacter corallicola]QTD47924.1 molybdenum cofactor biosynthesis protein MoaE [Sulfidibacter corallicola]
MSQSPSTDTSANGTSTERKGLECEVAVIRAPIDIEALNRGAVHPACGAVLTFSGTVRNHHLGRPVVRLAYEAYEGMAEAEMRRVAAGVAEKWPDVRRVQVVHRFGEMDVGASSIYITVSAPHRPEGFEALRYVIDRIKRDVPIWKKEFYRDGESEWLHPEEGCCRNHLHLEDSEASSAPPKN